MEEHVHKEYNVVYINCTKFYSKIFSKINNEYGLNLKSKDLKKLIFHYLITDLLLVSKIKKSKEKPVFFFCSDEFSELNSSFFVEFLNVIKLVKSYLPVPVLIFKNSSFLTEKLGDIKGLNEKIYNFYFKRSHSIKKLKKYLEFGEYYDLIKILGEAKHIKTLVN